MVMEGTLLAADYASTQVEVTGEPRSLAAPAAFRLGSNYPNPFNSSTQIRFDLPAIDGFAAVPVSVDIFNALGQCIRLLMEEPLFPGFHETV